MPWPNTLAAVHKAQSMRPHSADLSNSTVSDPVLDLAEGLLHEVQHVLLSRDVPAPPAVARAPAKGGRGLERAPHRARPGRAAT